MGADNSKVRFQLFRYQLLPLQSEKQYGLSSPVKDIKNIEELKKRKNEFFIKALLDVKKFDHQFSEINHKILFEGNDRVIIKIAPQKNVELTDKDFSKKEYEDWPPIVVYVDNRPHIQTLLIENNRNVFSSPQVVANLFENTLNHKLKEYFLAIYIKPRFEEHEFWELVRSHENKIKQVNFELISPNLADISGGLELDLGQLNNDTNSHKTNLELNSEQNSHLSLDKSNDMISSLVKYSSDGGGDISMKVEGVRKKIHTKNTVKEIEIENLEISNVNPTELGEILDKLQ
jgi:hypothetical protein